MKLCSCGQPLRRRVKALVCFHCDEPMKHAPLTCIRCIAIGLGKSSKP